MSNQQSIQIFEKTSAEDLAKLPTNIAGGSILNSPQALAHLGNVARFFAYSKLVPDHYQGKPHEIFIALESARNLGVDPMVYLQGTTVIHGRQGMFASLINSLLKRSGVIVGAVRYEEEQANEVAFNNVKNIRIRAYATEKETGEILYGPWVDLHMAKAEGWAKNTKYTSMPSIMLEKRALTFFTRRFFPEVLNGMHEVSEIEDMHLAPTPENAPKLAPEFSENPIEKPVVFGNGKDTGGEKKQGSKKEEAEDSQPPRAGSKAWYHQELDKIGVNFDEDSDLKTLKKLYSDALKKEKEKKAAEEAEVIEPQPKEDPLEDQEEGSLPPVDYDNEEDFEDEDFGDIFGED